MTSQEIGPFLPRGSCSNTKDPDPAGDSNEDADPNPHTLIQAVLGLVARRESVLKARQELHASLRPNRQKLYQKVLDQVKRSCEESVREALADERSRARQQAYKARRLAPKPLEEMSNQELQGEIDYAINEEREKKGIARRKGEKREEWLARINTLYHKVDEIGYMLFTRQRREKVIYIEGYPSNVLAVHPKFMPPQKPVWSHAGKCLQCRAKRLPCSHDVQSKYIAVGDGECTRCRRHGEKCLVKMQRGDEDLPWNYLYAKKGSVEDDSEEAIDELYELLASLWAIRIRESRIRPLEMWHENDHPKNKQDPTYKPLSWKNVLGCQPTKWRFQPSGSRDLVAIQEPGGTSMTLQN